MRGGTWVAGGWGRRESVNSLDIRCPDLASGGREDGLATKDQLRRHRRGGTGGWRCGGGASGQRG